ncbi:MAG: ACP S-malonyltransferase [Dehalococcoidia bacterium]
MSNGKSIAYIFPGQGSQSAGMGRDLYEESPVARAIYDHADEVLGFPLSKLCFSGSEEELRQTENAQPAILTTSIATMWALAESWGDRPAPLPWFVAGHSLGEYTALVAAGALDFIDALLLVQERGKLMHEAGRSRKGGMAAILGLDEPKVQQVCQETGVEIANINGEDQIVISGRQDAVGQAMALSGVLGAHKTVPLVVGGAFHSSLMEPAVSGMAAALRDAAIHPPTIPIIGNCTGEPLYDVDSLHSELLEQMYTCVQWSKSMEYMTANGVGTFVEIGPGRVLTNLVRRIAPRARAISVNDLPSVKSFAGYQSNSVVIRVAVGTRLRAFYSFTGTLKPVTT